MSTFTPASTPAVHEPRRRQGVILASLVALNLAGGLLLQWYTLAILGVGSETDALFAGLALPQAMLAIVASSFMTVLVPLLSGESDVRFRQNAWTFAASTLVGFLVIAGLLALLAPWWVVALVPGLPAPTRTLTIHLARIQLIGMVCTALGGVMGAVQRARHNFIWTEVAPLLGTITAGTVLVLSLPLYGIHAAAWVQVLRVGLHAALLLPGLGRFAGFSRDRGTLVAAWHRMRPLIFGTAYSRTEPLVDRGLSSLGPPGDLSLYYLCLQICTATTQLAYNALIAPLVPVLARQAKQSDWPAFDRARQRSFRTLLWLGIAAFTLLLAVSLVTIAVGVLPSSTEAMTRRAVWQLLGLGGVLVAVPLAESSRTVFYATGNTATPVRLDAVVFTCGLVMKVTGYMLFGVWGLAVAASAQALLATFVLRRGLAEIVRQPAGAA